MKDSQCRYNKLIENFHEQCEKWQKRGIDAVFNTDLADENICIDDVKYIVVADNPGENEKVSSRYLCESDEGNRSGCIARQIFSMIFKGDSYLVLNKTPIHTSETDGLKQVPETILKETMEYMANLIYDLNKINKNIQVYIFGLGSSFDSENERLRKGGIGKDFFWKIKELYAKSDLKIPIIAKHFSYYSLFQDFSIENDGVIVCKKMKLKELCVANADAFLKAMNDLPYKDWMMNA